MKLSSCPLERPPTQHWPMTSSKAGRVVGVSDCCVPSEKADGGHSGLFLLTHYIRTHETSAMYQALGYTLGHPSRIRSPVIPSIPSVC